MSPEDLTAENIQTCGLLNHLAAQGFFKGYSGADLMEELVETEKAIRLARRRVLGEIGSATQPAPSTYAGPDRRTVDTRQAPQAPPPGMGAWAMVENRVGKEDNPCRGRTFGDLAQDASQNVQEFLGYLAHTYAKGSYESDMEWCKGNSGKAMGMQKKRKAHGEAAQAALDWIHQQATAQHQDPSEGISPAEIHGDTITRHGSYPEETPDRDQVPF